MLTIRAAAHRAVLLTLTVLFAVCAAPPAVAADPPVSRDTVYRSLKVDDVPAAYVVLVDVSSSMQDRGPDGVPLYTTVKRRLADFLTSLTPADQVAVVTFGRATSVVHPMSPANRTGDLFAKELPSSAGESASDHGAALDAAADQLDRSTAPVGAVLMLTDGAVNAPGSPYARLGSPAWKQLKQRFDTLGSHRRLMGYGLPLAQGTGVSEVLGSAFGAPRILPVDPTALGSQLSAAKDQVRTQKALTLLRADRNAAVGVTVAGAGVGAARDGHVGVATGGGTGTRTRTLEVTLTSRARHVPLTVRLTSADASGATLTAPGGPVTLEPGRSRTVRVTLTWQQDPEFALIPGDGDFRAGVGVRTVVGSPWTSTVRGSLGDAAFSPGRSTVTLLDLRGTVPGRTPGWLYPLVLLVLLLGGAAARAAHRRRHPELSGFLVVTDLRSGERQTMPLRGREVVQDTDAGEVRARVTVCGRQEAGRLVLVLRCDREAPRPGGERLRDSGTCELGKSTVLCGIGFSHETESQSAVLR
ncbi:vWA domain-containing protein [Streptomyces tropicalis]|uniref:VWA domain-containing protein n=1 Tax=Streptomyces tropicalis TaxID=3034234 RepID=A0ABT6AAK4_9ACTN|nr:vWA domain-containing protein [Streptomyces tropicalis]MDF3301356.1 VWA domain-containing protein [Streptomyces tropicalis]